VQGNVCFFLAAIMIYLQVSRISKTKELLNITKILIETKLKKKLQDKISTI
jgi:hypothetical protein